MVQYLKINKKNGLYSKGKNDLFAVLISMKYLIDSKKFQKIIGDINSCINTLFSETHQIQRSQLYKYMGLPGNWIKIGNCPLEPIVN